MFDYLQQFNSLPKDLRDRVSSPLVMAAVTNLENKYKVDLAMTIMKVMIKSLAIKNLPLYFIDETGLAPEVAENLTRDLKEQVFSSVAEHLGLKAEMRALDLERDIEILIKEAGLILPSANLVSRFKNILATYLRGVRSKIDTRNSLSKDAKIGGLNLSLAEIDRVLKICDSGKFKSNAPMNIAPSPTKPMAFVLPPEEYNLKQALASGETKPVVKSAGEINKTETNKTETKIENKVSTKPISSLDTKHEISAPVTPLDLAAPSKLLELTKPAEAEKPILKPKLLESVRPSVVVKPTEPVRAFAPLKPKEPTKPVQPIPAQPIIGPVKKIEPIKLVEPVKVLENIKNPAPEAVKIVPPPAPVQTVKSVAPGPVAARRPVAAPISARPQMHDIKPIPKVMGPIEELQFLDPLNFRRLGKTPVETTAKIFAKIKLLERDGYDKMVAGVRAWRQSPVNRLYLRLGQEAIVKGIFLKEAISAREKAGQEFLSMEEIEAVVSLNSKLVF